MNLDWSLLLTDVIWSGVAAVGFAILFNVPPRTLLGCLICGASGHFLRTFLMQFGIGIAPATLVGAGLVGVLSAYFARRYRAPSLIFAICGAIPMVPGSFAYRTMLGLIRISTAQGASGEPILIEMTTNFVNTGLILAAIALGIAFPTLWLHRRPPVV
ncbi:MAG: threonine/serine exporter family protein [Anaerolinea sp.]|nr:threonine/serine exporter family protein [Anaerolinea sp.]